VAAARSGADGGVDCALVGPSTMLRMVLLPIGFADREEPAVDTRRPLP